ncbi:hypothetical protein CSA56_00270 [candidate division KSB3 bacterium]|uniref:Methyl-accepting transducer domain-containing protein n=1 Tax=candidate division KSB3 bacterium TaxID=2044937 RepID=A0A2G6KNS3_9BACT|nr:MAG: hypothetical protein CSA56_00270 [candidate division KSB3 bacterium]
MTDDMTTATREHQLSTGQTNQAIAHINDMTLQIQQATTQQLNGIHQVLEVMKGVTTFIDQNLESSQQITRTTGKLSSQAEILLQSVDRFKLNAKALKETG